MKVSIDYMKRREQWAEAAEADPIFSDVNRRVCGSWQSIHIADCKIRNCYLSIGYLVSGGRFEYTRSWVNGSGKIFEDGTIEPAASMNQVENRVQDYYGLRPSVVNMLMERSDEREPVEDLNSVMLDAEIWTGED